VVPSLTPSLPTLQNQSVALFYAFITVTSYRTERMLWQSCRGVPRAAYAVGGYSERGPIWDGQIYHSMVSSPTLLVNRWLRWQWRAYKALATPNRRKNSEQNNRLGPTIIGECSIRFMVP
jgi:hypothetical protein